MRGHDLRIEEENTADFQMARPITVGALIPILVPFYEI
jgi:hypothetical protein